MPKIRTIEPPGEGRTPETVGKEILELIRGDYRWTVAMLGELFCVERRFVEKYIQPEVECIHVNRFFGEYIIETLQPEEELVRFLRRGRYLFSEADLLRFWSEHASADRKTVPADLAAYRKPDVDLYEFRSTMRTALGRGGERAAKAAAKSRLEQMLTAEGALLLTYRGKKSPDWVPAVLPPLPLRTSPRLKSTAKIMEESGGQISSGSVAFQHMYGSGAVHITLLGRKVLWYVRTDNPETCISVPASLF